jgi:hypothetical protein
MNEKNNVLKAAANSGVLIGVNMVDRTQNIELAACLSTLGFKLIDMTRLVGDGLGQQADGVVTWRFAPVSDDGKYTINEVMAAWNNDAWLTDPNNEHPLAYIICAFRNRQRHLDWIKQGRAMVAVKSGQRWALIPEDCSARVEVMAKRFLSGR